MRMQARLLFYMLATIHSTPFAALPAACRTGSNSCRMHQSDHAVLDTLLKMDGRRGHRDRLIIGGAALGHDSPAATPANLSTMVLEIMNEIQALSGVRH